MVNQHKPSLAPIRQRVGLSAIGLLFAFTLAATAAEPAEHNKDDEELAGMATTEVDSARFYRTPEERRDAGLGTALTEWLNFYGLLEVEQERFYHRFSDRTERIQDPQASTTLQLGLDIDYDDFWFAEVVFEAEHDRYDKQQTDEALIGIQLDDIDISFGRQYLPFGEYFSGFVTGPILEIGETRDHSIIIDYSPLDEIEISVFGFHGNAHGIGESNGNDWGAAFDWVLLDEALRLGASYLSDMAETRERLLYDEHDLYACRVSAWSAYVFWGSDDVIVTLEVLKLNRRFVELEPGEARPSASNFELGFFLRDNLQLSLRYERSDDVDDEPSRQHGLALAWRPLERFGLSVEYLRGQYDRAPFSDLEEVVQRERDLYTVQLVLEL